MPLFRIQYEGRTNQNIHDPATVRNEPSPGRRRLFLTVVLLHILPQGAAKVTVTIPVTVEDQIPPSGFQ